MSKLKMEQNKTLKNYLNEKGFLTEHYSSVNTVGSVASEDIIVTNASAPSMYKKLESEIKSFYKSQGKICNESEDSSRTFSQLYFIEDNQSTFVSIAKPEKGLVGISVVDM